MNKNQRTEFIVTAVLIVLGCCSLMWLVMEVVKP